MDVKMFFENRNKSNHRYLGVGISSTRSSVLRQVKDDLMQHLSPIEIWSSPGAFSAPAIPIPRSAFCDKAFEERHEQGLLINLPEEWMFDWKTQDKIVFWAQLAETYGINNIYVVFNQTPANTQLVNQHFIQHTFTDTHFSIWTSKHELKYEAE